MDRGCFKEATIISFEQSEKILTYPGAADVARPLIRSY